ncbi:uncharacterized protein CDV56_109405 [Aspergillus thermomutatus]|uniref:Uncharacterized protein n=1 Tax=Aspergillus thermomutatus TaxID=41047 RepID=A0A397HVU7_ASPTH|nr:uncharacterized protein CDV56_109405 [Aspergillus thermomutatus]RHZ67361.1 hypothetical protein CDV56_109405 [Aspergillus thermomutatus]
MSPYRGILPRNRDVFTTGRSRLHPRRPCFTASGLLVHPSIAHNAGGSIMGLREGRHKAPPFNFKKRVKELPILRGTCQDAAGLLVTNPQRALQYHQGRQWEAAASESAGFKDKGTLYKYRKGGRGEYKSEWHLDEHSWNCIMDDTQQVPVISIPRDTRADIESNHWGEQIKFTPDDSQIQPERIALANLEFDIRCKNFDQTGVRSQDLVGVNDT